MTRETLALMNSVGLSQVVKTSNDNIIQTSFLAAANKCLAQIEAEFGLTPSSRSRIPMAEPAETADPFEDFLTRGRKA